MGPVMVARHMTSVPLITLSTLGTDGVSVCKDSVALLAVVGTCTGHHVRPTRSLLPRNQGGWVRPNRVSQPSLTIKNTAGGIQHTQRSSLCIAGPGVQAAGRARVPAQRAHRHVISPSPSAWPPWTSALECSCLDGGRAVHAAGRHVCECHGSNLRVQVMGHRLGDRGIDLTTCMGCPGALFARCICPPPTTVR